jgi:hypothetical protein
MTPILRPQMDITRRLRCNRGVITNSRSRATGQDMDSKAMDQVDMDPKVDITMGAMRRGTDRKGSTWVIEGVGMWDLWKLC